ncbi:hypothetical protein HZS_7673, partial [Henneguya salminicola]
IQTRPSKVFQVYNANILFNANHVVSYRNFEWRDDFVLLGPKPPDIFTESSFVSYIHVYICTCKDGDDYDTLERGRVNQWLQMIKAIGEEAGLMIIYMTATDTPISVKKFFTRSIFDRIKRDFGSLSPVYKCAQLINPHKKANAFNSIVNDMLESHRSILMNFVSKSESNFFEFWASIKSYSNWSMSEYFKRAFKLFVIYKQMMFIEEICEIYSTIYNNIFQYLRVAEYYEFPITLRNAYNFSKELLFSAINDGSKSFEILRFEITPANINPMESDVLQGRREPKTIFSLLFHIFGANLYCSLWHKNYTKLFKEICEFILEFKTLLQRFDQNVTDHFLNYWAIETSKWILISLNSVINSTGVVSFYNDNDPKPHFTMGLCHLLSLLCQTLKKCLLLYNSISLHSLIRNKLISISNDCVEKNHLTNLSFYTRSHRRQTSIDDINIPPYGVPCEIKLNDINTSNTSTQLLFSSSNQEFNSTSFISMNFDCNFASTNSIQSLNDNEFEKKHKIPFARFSQSKTCLEKIISVVSNLSAVLKNENDLTHALTTCALVVYYNTSLLFHHCCSNRLSTIYLYETARLFTISKHDQNALPLYSYVISRPKMHIWYNIWVSLLLRQLESLCKVQLLTQDCVRSHIITVSSIKSEKVFEKLMHIMTDQISTYNVLANLLYLSACCTKNRLSNSVSLLLFDYFQQLLSISEHNVVINADPIFQIKGIESCPKTKLNTTSLNSVKLIILNKLPRNLIFSNISVYFKPIKSLSLPFSSSSGSVSENEIINSKNDSKKLIFKSSNVNLYPGLNKISLINSDAHASFFVSYRIEFDLNYCVLVQHFNKTNLIRISTVFEPPVFTLTNQPTLIPGMRQILRFSLKNGFSCIKNSDNFLVKIYTDFDSTLDCVTKQIDEKNHTNEIHTTYELLKLIESSEKDKNKGHIKFICSQEDRFQTYRFDFRCRNCCVISHSVINSVGSNYNYLQVILENVIKEPIYITDMRIECEDKSIQFEDLSDLPQTLILSDCEEYSLLYKIYTNEIVFNYEIEFDVSID